MGVDDNDSVIKGISGGEWGEDFVTRMEQRGVKYFCSFRNLFNTDTGWFSMAFPFLKLNRMHSWWMFFLLLPT